MLRINDNELRVLKFGSKIKIIWNHSKYHTKDEEHYGLVFGDKIGWEDGKVDYLINIAESIYNDQCMVYLVTE